LKAYLQNNHNQHKQQVLHVIKAYAPKDHVEKWFNVSILKIENFCLDGAVARSE
jgi:hypothetical protein